MSVLPFTVGFLLRAVQTSCNTNSRVFLNSQLKENSSCTFAPESFRDSCYQTKIFLFSMVLNILF